MRDLMPFAHGNAAIDADVKIDIEIQPHFARAAFLHLEHARDQSGGRANRHDNFVAWRRVHDFTQRRRKKPIAVCAN